MALLASAVAAQLSTPQAETNASTPSVHTYHPRGSNEAISANMSVTWSIEQLEILLACTSNCFSSVGMLLFNKLAVQAFPLECCLVWCQLFFAAAFMLVFGFPYLHVGSLKDFLRWCIVVPFYCGMLLTSILALKNAPMSLLIVLRNASPLASLGIERLYPEPLRISAWMLGSIALMLAGALMYVAGQIIGSSWVGCMISLSTKQKDPASILRSLSLSLPLSFLLPLRTLSPPTFRTAFLASSESYIRGVQ